MLAARKNVVLHDDADGAKTVEKRFLCLKHPFDPSLSLTLASSDPVGESN